MQQPAENNRANFTLKKKERINSKLLLQRIISDGMHLFAYPFKCHLLLSPQLNPEDTDQMAVAVPKRVLKNAVERNRIKRLLRENYRLYHTQLLGDFKKKNNYRIFFLFVFVGKEVPAFTVVEKSLTELMKKISQLN